MPPANGLSSPVAPLAPVAGRGVDSPRGSLAAYFAATRAGRWEQAARYLSLSDTQRSQGARLARRLKGVIDGHHWIDLETLSAQPGGRLDDGLPPDVEEISHIEVDGHTDPLRMIRMADARGAFWGFSPATVARIETWYQTLPDRRIRDLLVRSHLDSLLRPGPFEVLRWQWLVLPFALLVGWALGAVFGRLTRLVLSRIAARTNNPWDDRLVACIGAPLTLSWSIAVFALCIRSLPLTDPARDFLDSWIFAGLVFALFWALRSSLSVLSERLMRVSWAASNASARHLLAVGTNLARAGILVLGLLAALAAFGYPVGTLLAGLGIGGLALAFGAQKTIENLFGSISLAVDQPVRVGDFVKVDDFVGTVEDIGLRSTRIRTLDRTVITMPNGKLADQRLESYEVRDRMRLTTTLRVTYDTGHEQMLNLLTGLEHVLRSHPLIWPDAVVVRFSEFGSSSLDVEVMAWFQVTTMDEFRRCRQEVLLGFMQVVEQHKVKFAFSTSTVYLQPVARESSDAADDAV